MRNIGPHETLAMAISETDFKDLKRYVGFGPSDVVQLRSLAEHMRPHLPEIVDEFYVRLAQHEPARAVLKQSGSTAEALQRSLLHWLEGLFSGVYDDHYTERATEIGRVHLSIQLPEHFMIMGMSVLRTALLEQIGELRLTDKAAKARAVNRLLDIELTLMVRAYHQGSSELIRAAGRAEMEARLAESEHLANIGQLAATLAHEIKNPLAGISGAIQVIGSSLDPGNPHREVIAEILTEIDRLDATARDLLIYARPKPPIRKKVQLGRLLQQLLMQVRQEPAVRGLRIRCDGLECAAEAYIDETQFRQVIHNLFLNAAHACEDGGEVSFRLSTSDAMVRVQVIDTGVGMSAREAQRAFEPFYTTKAKGTGLGLSICQWIVDSHGGKIAMESEPGRGTSVTIDLPNEP